MGQKVGAAPRGRADQGQAAGEALHRHPRRPLGQGRKDLDIAAPEGLRREIKGQPAAESHAVGDPRLRGQPLQPGAIPGLPLLAHDLQAHPAALARQPGDGVEQAFQALARQQPANAQQPDELQIFDVYGKLVRSYVISGGAKNIRINKADMSSGIYFYKLISTNTVIASGKLCAE